MTGRERDVVAENEALRGEVDALRAENAALRADNASLTATVEELTRRVGEVEHRQKTSRTSSMPPSKDSHGDAAEARRSRTERRAEKRAADKAGKRRRGKQPGAPGANLAAVERPDEVVPHNPQCCSTCGDDLASAAEEGYDGRQVFDISDPRLVVTEHRSIRKRCRCGTLNRGEFPTEASAPTAYGPNMRSAALYLLHGQHLSVERTVEALSELLGVEVSPGFVASLVPEAGRRLEESGFLEALRERVRAAQVINVDETSDQVGTKTWWLHVAATKLYTYLVASRTRGKDAPDRAGVLGRFSGVMVHDRLVMYFAYEGATHAVCAAHLLRDLESVGKWQAQKVWTEAMATLLREMIGATNAAREAGRTRLPTRPCRTSLTATTRSSSTAVWPTRRHRTGASRRTTSATRPTPSRPSRGSRRRSHALQKTFACPQRTTKPSDRFECRSCTRRSRGASSPSATPRASRRSDPISAPQESTT